MSTRLSQETKQQIFEQLTREVSAFSVDPRRACMVHALLLPRILREYGIRSCIQAGSASFLFKDISKDDGGPTHYSYVFENSEMTRQCLTEGCLPELHCWIGIPATQEIIDTTTGHLMELQRIATPDEGWTAPPPPPFLWCDCDNLPNGWVYRPSVEAIKIALYFLRISFPDLYAVTIRAGLV